MTPLFLNLFTGTSLLVGTGCLLLQLTLTALFSSNIVVDGPWRKLPSFTAHQVVAGIMVTYLSVVGTYTWLFVTTQQQQQQQDSNTTTMEISAVDRLTTIPTSSMHLSEVVLGMMVLWDIPTALWTPTLRDIAMVLHHIGMGFTAALALGLLSDNKPVFGYFGPFYFGVIECSSIPLIVVDVFHPKHRPYFDFLRSSPTWTSINESARILFAILFLLLRAIYFPFVSLFVLLPDVYTVTRLPLDERNFIPNVPLYTMAAINVLFSLLQLYWGALIVRQILKMLSVSDNDKKTKRQ